MTRIINGNQTAKGAGRHFLAIASVAVGLTAASLGFAGCQASTGSTIENPSGKEYDSNGWNIKDAADLQNKNGTLYDNDGYNRGGYDMGGYDRQGLDKDGNPREQGGGNPEYDKNGWNIKDTNDLQNKNGTLYDNDGYNRGGYDVDGYNRQGLDKDGNPKQSGNTEHEINGVSTDGLNVNVLTKYTDGSGSYNLATDTKDRYTNSLGGGGFFAIAVDDLIIQTQNLKDGYTAAANEYKDGVFGSIKSALPTTLRNIILEDGNVNQIVNAIFGNDTAGKTAFNADLAAYESGHFYKQKQRFSDNSLNGNGNEGTGPGFNNRGSTQPTHAEQLAKVQEFITAAHNNSPLSSGTVTKDNLATLLNELKSRMLTQINTKTGVGTTVTNNANKNLIEILNEGLLSQIGEDRGQMRALYADVITDLQSPLQNLESDINYMDKNYPITMGTQKAGSAKVPGTV
jgi:hypothetical protein